ncbi:MAG: cation transporter [candidate division Zixibacteria bacterium]|jgi:copper chaperone CopZ|nr:cation transporter [candidate division Zixibacteria bacterium]
MKKMTLFAIAALAFVAFAVMPATGFACGADKSAKTTAAADKAEAKTVSSKSACGAKVDATQANAKANCDPSACASKATTAAATSDAKATMVGSKSSCGATATKAGAESACSAGKSDVTTAAADADMAGFTLVKMSVNGMTCGGCEKSVTAALEKVDGVVKVKKVCSSEGVALVYVDPAKVKDNALLTTAVANKGFAAEVIPAVSKTSSETSMTKTGADACSKTCTAAEKAACSGTKKTSETKMTAAGTN